MPEAPEVATVLHTLQESLQDAAIEKVEITHPKLADNMSVSEFAKALRGQHFRGFHRLGKYLVFEMDTLDWVAHLRMEGKLYVADALPEDPKIAKHIHAVFTLSNGQYLLYQDSRKFGRMQLYEKTEDISSLPILAKNGLDVLSPALNGKYLYGKLHKKRIPIKTALLDQSIIAGIGNIYADEILFESGIHPLTPCSQLEEAQLEEIARHTASIMEKAMEAKGTTIRTFSFDQSHAGSYQDQLKVHDRQDAACPVCGSPIEKITVNNRSTYLCPHCQKRKDQ